MFSREQEIRSLASCFPYDENQLYRTLLNYEWCLTPTRTSDVKNILTIIDNNSHLFSITDKLYQMLSFLFLKGHDPYTCLNRLDLFKLCVDVGFVNICHHNDYITFKTGAVIVNRYSILIRGYKRCEYYYIQRVMITV